MNDDNKDRKNKQVGRKPKVNPSKHRYTVNLNNEENDKFRLLLEQSEVENISRFIHHAVFSKEIKIVKVDKATMDYYIRLTNFYHQFQMIGNNYNQTVKALKTNFSEKRALALLYKLEKATIELVLLSKQIVALTREFEDKYLSK
ncbi:MobA protein [Dysgonomonas sp. GY75]|uniref:conjugal transfer protein MobA n=1 Tax=Dysgonomonas sp. GY75 TaxID=2780419 RepID=UPI0018844D82|nr:conjugal transfer protein MobA [Dysgonomonas sp. GY75]MBF0651551.1 MobA protein [Dysgonomonas sp. GY75]